MTRDCLAHIIQLREKGRAEQDQSVLEEARTRLLELVVAYPDDAEVNFQTAVVHDNLGLERESIPFYLRALGQGLSGPDLERSLLGLGSTYRVLGEYQKAEETLRLGVREFPDTGLSRSFWRSPFTIRSSTRRRWNLSWSIFWKPPRTKNCSISNEVFCTTAYTLMRHRHDTDLLAVAVEM